MNVIKADPADRPGGRGLLRLAAGEAVLDLDYAEDSTAEADANFVLTDSGGIVEIQATAEKRAVHRGAVPRAAGAGADRAPRRCSRRSARPSRPPDGAPARSPAAGWCWPATIPGKLRGDRRAAAAARDARWCRPAHSACRSRRRTRRTSSAMRGSRRWRRRGRAGCRRWRTIPVFALPRWAARRGCSRRAGPGRRRISPPPWRGCTRRWAIAADRRAWFVAALCLAWPDGHTETFVGRVDGRQCGRRAATRGFGYDPMFVPAGGDADVRRDGAGGKARGQPPCAGIRAACCRLPGVAARRPTPAGELAAARLDGRYSAAPGARRNARSTASGSPAMALR